MAKPVLGADMNPVTVSRKPRRIPSRIPALLLERVLLRHTGDTSPETRFLVAIIGQAFADIQSRSIDPRTCLSASDFINGKGLDRIAQLVGLEPSFVRELIANGRSASRPEKLATSIGVLP
ncbi:hypothetical protein CCP4SC76_3650005 [Gammaproteobacteria bacterium]